MDFELTEEQKQLKSMMRDFCKKEIDPKRIRDIESKVYNAKTCDEVRAVFPRDLLVKLNDLGLRQLCVPAKYGGTAPETGGNVTRAIVVEEMAYQSAGAATLLATPFMIAGANTTAKYVTEAQKDRFFKKYMEDPKIWFAGSVTSPSGGTDTHMPYDEPGGTLMDITAEKHGKEWVINGDKMFCSGGATADAMAVLVRTDKNGPITQSATHFLVPLPYPGITQVLNRFSGVEICGNAQTYFDNVTVPEDAIMGEVNRGYYSMSDAGMTYKWMMLLPFLGEIRRVYDDVVVYAKQRIQSGKPLIQHSQVMVMLGEAAANIEALRNYLYRTAWETDLYEVRGGRPNLFWSLGYLYLFKKLGLRVSEIARDIYGGIGASVDHPLEWFNRRIWTWQSAGLPTNIDAIKCCREYNFKDPDHLSD
jgi:alkylation response protein AidB-like acyl-CoA dehydrogenase